MLYFFNVSIVKTLQKRNRESGRCDQGRARRRPCARKIPAHAQHDPQLHLEGLHRRLPQGHRHDAVLAAVSAQRQGSDSRQQARHRHGGRRGRDHGGLHALRPGARRLREVARRERLDRSLMRTVGATCGRPPMMLRTKREP